jgi:membrane protein
MKKKINEVLKKEIKIFSFTLKNFLNQRLLDNASILAFSTILSLVPILSVLFMSFKMFGGKDIVDNNLKPYIYKFLNPTSTKQINQYIDSFINSSTIETLGTINFFFLIITVFLIISSIENTFNRIWQIESNRNFIKKIKTYWLIITLSPILLLFSLSFTSLLKYFYKSFSIIEDIITFSIFEIIPFFIISLFLTILLMFIPNYNVKFKYAFQSALVGTFLYYIGKELFLYYTKMAVSYHTIYGSMSILPLFFIWIYIFWIIILFTVELNFVKQSFYYLELENKYSDINYYDYLKLGIYLSKTIINDYIKSKPIKSIYQLSLELKLPLSKIKLCLDNLEKANVLRKKYENYEELYIPNIPINQIKISTIISALNKDYIDNITIFESDSDVNKIISNYINISEDKLIIDII